MRKTKRIVWALINMLGFIFMVTVNALANILPINDKNTGALSDKYSNLFVPAGLTFAVWGVIYILLLIFSVFLLVSAFRSSEDEPSYLDKIDVFYLISSLANAGWIFAWHYENVALSLLLMVLLLLSLIVIYQRLRIGISTAGAGEKYLIHLPVSVYSGWISIATIANVTAFLVKINWNRFGLSEQFWTIIVILAGIALALIMVYKRKDIFYALVVDWALLGILLKRLANPGIPAQAVIAAVITGMVIITLSIIMQIIRKKVY